MTTPTPTDGGSFLRTLAPLVKSLEKQLRVLMDAAHPYPYKPIERAELEGIADDLSRKAASLDVDQPQLVIMLMGGTGVGKSTLMNALAGQGVAQASFTRPTTREPVVYFHQALNPDRLDPALRHCRLVRHQRAELLHKIIVDTPDLDSNDLANRERLLEVLPIADVVLYVGSQEKYHDEIGWDLFRQQRKRRAFAFVLNKWDRCLHDGATGLRPDDDWLRDLTNEGFQSPRLFRTNAQTWYDARLADRAPRPDELPDGEQFKELEEWLELGLTRREIEVVKARGVGQLLASAQELLTRLTPPSFALQASRTQTAWHTQLETHATDIAMTLVASLDPHQSEIEHQFNVRGQQRFRGLTAAYLRLTTKLRYAGTTLSSKMSLMPRLSAGKPNDDLATIDLTEFAHNCARSAGERVLDQQNLALANRLLIEADQRGFPLNLLSERTLAVTHLDWDDKFTRAMVETLTEVEAECSRPTGVWGVVRRAAAIVANYLPETVLISTIILLMWRFFVEEFIPTFFHVLLPVYATLGTLIVLHIMIAVVFPVRWLSIRDEFATRLSGKLRREYHRAYDPVPSEVADLIERQRSAVEAIQTETRVVNDWLTQQESRTQLQELYGSEVNPTQD